MKAKATLWLLQVSNRQLSDHHANAVTTLPIKLPTGITSLKCKTDDLKLITLCKKWRCYKSASRSKCIKFATHLTWHLNFQVGRKLLKNLTQRTNVIKQVASMFWKNIASLLCTEIIMKACNEARLFNSLKWSYNFMTISVIFVSDWEYFTMQISDGFALRDFIVWK